MKFIFIFRNFYKDLEACNYNPIEFANCFISRYNPFYELYSKYCQNNRKYEILFSFYIILNTYFKFSSLNASEKLEKNREAEKILQVRNDLILFYSN